MIKTIPAKTIVTCDVCGCEIVDNAKYDYYFYIHKNVFDYYWQKSGEDEKHYDLCDNCGRIVEKDMLASMEFIREKNKMAANTPKEEDILGF